MVGFGISTGNLCLESGLILTSSDFAQDLGMRH